MRATSLEHNDYWRVKAHYPTKGTKNLVTAKILELDTKTCDTLLRRIYDDMSSKDMKDAIFQ